MKQFNPEGHTNHQFDVELNDVKHKVMTMGGLVESMVDDGLEALLSINSDLGHKAVSYTHLTLPTKA